MNGQHRSLTTRRTALLVVATLTAVTLGGCVAVGRSGQPASTSPNDPASDSRTTAQVTDELGQLPGVSAAFVSTGPVGLPNQLELTVGLNLEAGYPGDVPALLDYTLAMAWSATVEQPTTTAAVAFRDGDSALDLAPAAAALGWTGMTGPTLAVSMDEMADRYGPWPGPVPEKPAALG
ncbi:MULTISPECIES: hypothetical protein [Cryobacterium]|uniref:Uncharacterized protein n=1 Tax=Cryobacterium zongtaii TaxID=1259217 RepID=A0A2S3ZMI3_9MICO|nr:MULTISPECIES: hypothetical protein [Cryobacterium]POH68497.1 hypothetical protein C3B60_04705 [Cryobacterium zongtaii]POH70114.1 hypothetical protein C3B61_00390 [Cryobacterium zongtaii]TFC49184.1 hypothetical protein E3O57_00530 [Cryobacterium sp. TMN-39-2]